MVTEQTKDRLREQTKEIKVIPINMDALNSDIDNDVKENVNKAGDSSFAPKIEEGEFFKFRGKFGVVKGTNFLIDEECVGWESDKPTLDIYSEIRHEDGKKSFGIFPRFTKAISLTYLIKEFGQGEVSLEEFMGDRFAYNNRIANNIREILR